MGGDLVIDSAGLGLGCEARARRREGRFPANIGDPVSVVLHVSRTD